MYDDKRHPRLSSSWSVRYKFGSSGSPKAPPAPSPVPRKVEVDVAAAKEEERDIAARRRNRSRSILTRDVDLTTANTSKTELFGL